jgi:hypothetical protein
MLAVWAARWGISPYAMTELMDALGAAAHPTIGDPVGTSEAAVQNAVRLEAARRGIMLWRNNVGAVKDERGVPIRFGLANDSPAVNKVCKSSDLIGISPQGQFLAYECKHAGWHYTGNDHEKAQLNYITLVNAKGGRAAFITSPEEL